MLVYDNKTCSQKKNLIGSSYVDTNIEDWTDWYGSQPHIDEVTDQILSWWTVLPAARRPAVSYFQTEREKLIT